MSSIMRARSGLTGRSEVSEVIGALSRAEGCWTFDARDRMPRPSRATALHLVENAPGRDACSLPRAGSFFGATLPSGYGLANDWFREGFRMPAEHERSSEHKGYKAVREGF